MDFNFPFDDLSTVNEVPDTAAAAGAPDVYSSDIMVQGGPSNLPTVSDQPESSNDTPFSGLTKLLGSIGTTARDVGTAVGTIQRDVKTARGQYDQARVNAATGSSVGQWWQYSTTMDKVMVGLAIAVVAVVLLKR